MLSNITANQTGFNKTPLESVGSGQVQQPTFDGLPTDIIRSVASKLPLPDVLHLRQVCKHTRNSIKAYDINEAKQRVQYHFNTFSQLTDVYKSSSELNVFITYFRDTFIPKFCKIISAEEVPVKSSEMILKRLYGTNKEYDFYAGELEVAALRVDIKHSLPDSKGYRDVHEPYSRNVQLALWVNGYMTLPKRESLPPRKALPNKGDTLMSTLRVATQNLVENFTETPLQPRKINTDFPGNIFLTPDFELLQFESCLKFITIGSRLKEDINSKYGLISTGSGEQNQLYVARSFDDVIKLIRKNRNDIHHDSIERIFSYDKKYT